MNRIVRENYPVEKLPADLRSGLPEGATVTVTVEEADKPGPEEMRAFVADVLENAPRMTWRELRQMVGPRGVTPEEAVARIRAQRDAWDD